MQPDPCQQHPSRCQDEYTQFDADDTPDMRGGMRAEEFREDTQAASASRRDAAQAAIDGGAQERRVCRIVHPQKEQPLQRIDMQMAQEKAPCVPRAPQHRRQPLPRCMPSARSDLPCATGIRDSQPVAVRRARQAVCPPPMDKPHADAHPHLRVLRVMKRPLHTHIKAHHPRQHQRHQQKEHPPHPRALFSNIFSLRMQIYPPFSD